MPSISNIPHQEKTSCSEVTKSSKSNFISAFRFLPKEKMHALIKVYAFFRIADDCVDELSDPQEKEQALNFWENELNKTYNNESCHPIMEDLKPVLERFSIPKEYLTGLIEGCRKDIYQNRYSSLKELNQYCYQVASLVGLTCLKIFEYQSPNAEQMAIDLGMAFQLTNIIRDIQGDLHMNRLYIAQEDLEKVGYSEEDLKNKNLNSAYYELMRLYANRALDYYEKAEKEFAKDAENKLIAAKVMSAVYKNILHKIIKENYPVLEKRVSLSLFQKFRILFPMYFKFCLQN